MGDRFGVCRAFICPFARAKPVIDGRLPQARLSVVMGQQLGLSTQARVKAACEFTAQPKLGNGGGALERWPRK